jgi:hypothetical protein
MALVQIFQDYERGTKYVMNIDFSKNNKVPWESKDDRWSWFSPKPDDD